MWRMHQWNRRCPNQIPCHQNQQQVTNRSAREHFLLFPQPWNLLSEFALVCSFHYPRPSALLVGQILHKDRGEIIRRDKGIIPRQYIAFDG